MALSVGEPEKKRETSELNELEAFMPKISNTTPPTRRARARALFIIRLGVVHADSQRAAACNQLYQHHDNGDHQKDVDEATHSVGTDQSQEPQNDQNNSNGVEHRYSFGWGLMVLL